MRSHHRILNCLYHEGNGAYTQHPSHCRAINSRGFCVLFCMLLRRSPQGPAFTVIDKAFQASVCMAVATFIHGRRPGNKAAT